MAAQLQYLTVQDVLWINLEATRKRNAFSYATLEEATYYQYAYGESDSLVPQAARFLSGFVRRRPFEAGNEVTAFIAVFAFLRANGAIVNLQDSEGARWSDTSSDSRKSALEGLQQAATFHTGEPDEPAGDEPHEHTGAGSGVRGSIESVLIEFPETIQALVKRV